jgi:hypothetical protein
MFSAQDALETLPLSSGVRPNVTQLILRQVLFEAFKKATGSLGNLAEYLRDIAGTDPRLAMLRDK